MKAFMLQRLNLILLLAVILLTSGCTKKTDDVHLQVSLDSISDTLYQGSEAQVFFADGLGGYYFDDALNRPLRSEYGYSRGEWHLVSGWQVISPDGEQLNLEPEYSVIHPLWLSREYSNSLKEKVFIPRGSQGMVLQYNDAQKRDLIYRPVLDIRKLDREEAPSYMSIWDEKAGTLTVYRKDHKGSYITIACPEHTSFRNAEKTIRSQYQMSEFTGSPSSIIGWSPGEFTSTHPGKMAFSVSWADNPDSSKTFSQTILANQEQLESKRQTSATGILDKLILDCEDTDFVKAFAWARLNLFELGYKKSGGSYFLTGIPYDPFPNGFYTALAIGGEMAAGLTPDAGFEVIETLISHQQKEKNLHSAGMFPSAIREDSIEYRIPMIAGLVTDAYNLISDANTLPHQTEDELITAAMSDALLGTCLFRLQAGLVYSEYDQHFLYSGSSSPYRNGATIESQALFYKLRTYLKRFPQVHALFPYVPESLIEGVNHMQYGNKWVELMAVNTQGEYSMPLVRNLLLHPFGDFSKMQWADRLTYVRTDDMKTILAVKHNDKTIAKILATGWYDVENARNMERIYRMAIEDDMIGASGFRSLSPQEQKYQSAHIYNCPDDARGSLAYGDVLIWSSGLLGDVLASTKQHDLLLTLVDNLKVRTLTQGVYGALSEAENSVPVSLERDAVGDLIHLTSTAEFVRLVSDYIVGIDHREGQYLTIKPHFPSDWGVTTLTFDRDNGKVTVTKLDDLNFTITQTDIEPSLSIGLDLSPATGGHGVASFRLYPGETAEVEFEYTTKGYIRANVKRD